MTMASTYRMFTTCQALAQELHMSDLIESSNQPYEVGAIIMAIYREGKGGREVK